MVVDDNDGHDVNRGQARGNTAAIIEIPPIVYPRFFHFTIIVILWKIVLVSYMMPIHGVAVRACLSICSTFGNGKCVNPISQFQCPSKSISDTCDHLSA